MLKRTRLVDSVVTGALGYMLMLGWSACSSSGGSGGFLPDGGYPPGTGGSGGGMIAEAQAEQSGTRVKARRIRGVDGSSQFEGWVDTARGEECGFYRTTEGKRRCLPNGPSVRDSNGDYFADPACTVPVAWTDSLCAPLKYVFVDGDDPQSQHCGGAYEVISVHQAVPVTEVYSLNSTGCELDTGHDEQSAYAAGNMIPLTDFVEAQSSLD
jgi:hypothetical protein